jgi:polyphenol oxidase
VIARELPGAQVRFSTRAGGVSEGPYDSLNLGIQTGDDAERVVENRRRLGAAVGLGEQAIAIGQQVHGAAIERWDAPPASGLADARAERAEVDGHVTALTGVGLLVQVADCLPVALATPAAVAMVHCGWRGLAGGIVATAVVELCGDASDGAGRSGDPGAPISAVVGPGIGRCCFEVGPEVVEAFADVDAAVPSTGRPGAYMLDLRAVAEARLRAAGADRVEHVDLCTHCREDLFFSHRRDGGVTGRQCGMVWRP